MKLTLPNPLLFLCPAKAADKPDLCKIYGSTRTEELERVAHWTQQEKDAFVQWQFEVQHSYYQKNYQSAFFWLIKYGPDTIGRLYLHPQYDGGSVRIIDITLLPPWRGKGLGTDILSGIMTFAEAHRRSVTIHVESFNPAMRLYKKLGFTLVSKTNGVYHLLAWNPTKPVLV